MVELEINLGNAKNVRVKVFGNEFAIDTKGEFLVIKDSQYSDHVVYAKEKWLVEGIKIKGGK